LTVTANTALTITSVKDQSNWNIPDNGHTVHTSVTLTGSAPDGQKVEVFLGAISKGIAEAGPDRTWTRTVSGLSLDVLHTLKAVGQYANNPTSNLWRLTALNGVRPTITAAHDSNGQPISNGGNTVDRTVHLMGTATKYLEVEIYDGATATGKKARANDKGEWAVQLTGLTPTKHVFKAKALYGSGTESGEWIVNVVDLIDLVEDFQSYPTSVSLRTPGESVQGDSTGVTLNETLGGQGNNHRVDVGSQNMGQFFSMTSTRTAQNILAYSLALKQGRTKSAILRGVLSETYGRLVRLKLEFLQNNDVVDSITLFQGHPLHTGVSVGGEYAPRNGQSFNTLKFEIKALDSMETFAELRIVQVVFKS